MSPQTAIADPLDELMGQIGRPSPSHQAPDPLDALMGQIGTTTTTPMNFAIVNGRRVPVGLDEEQTADALWKQEQNEKANLVKLWAEHGPHAVNLGLVVRVRVEPRHPF